MTTPTTPEEAPEKILASMRRYATFLTHFGILQVGIAIGIALAHWRGVK